MTPVVDLSRATEQQPPVSLALTQCLFRQYSPTFYPLVWQ